MMEGSKADVVGCAHSEDVGRQRVAVSVWELRVGVADNGARNGI